MAWCQDICCRQFDLRRAISLSVGLQSSIWSTPGNIVVSRSTVVKLIHAGQYQICSGTKSASTYWWREFHQSHYNKMSNTICSAAGCILYWICADNTICSAAGCILYWICADNTICSAAGCILYWICADNHASYIGYVQIIMHPILDMCRSSGWPQTVCVSSVIISHARD